jgi:MFS family permease
MAMEFRTGFGPLTDLISWGVFALGISNLFWMPLAMCIGKRPVILVSMLIFLGGTIWSVKAKTLHSLLGARILATFGAGSVESLGPSMIADMFMERYFATAMALFAMFLSGGSQIGPVIAGYLIADRGWRCKLSSLRE